MKRTQRQELVAALGLALGYRGLAPLQDVWFRLTSGDVMAVVGHNGSGKSTFVKTLLGVLPPVAGGSTGRGTSPISAR